MISFINTIRKFQSQFLSLLIFTFQLLLLDYIITNIMLATINIIPVTI